MNISQCCTATFFPIQHSREIEIFEVPLISYFVKLRGYPFRHNTFAEEREGDPICD